MLGVVCCMVGVVEVFASRWACWQSPRGGEAEWTNNSKIGLMASDSHNPAHFYTESILSKYVIAAVSQKIFHLRPDALIRHEEFIHIEQLTEKCCNLAHVSKIKKSWLVFQPVRSLSIMRNGQFPVSVSVEKKETYLRGMFWFLAPKNSVQWDIQCGIEERRWCILLRNS